MKKQKLFNHSNSFYYPILEEYFKRQGKNYEEYIRKDNEWKKTREWFCNINDFKLLIDCSEERWEIKKKKKVRKKKKK